METITIYALVDPLTHLVRYVGQAHDPQTRYECHISDAQRGVDKPVYAWMRGLSPQRPHLVVLENVEARIVSRPRGNTIAIPSVMEAKWLKRFRRTVLNLNKKQCAVYDEFVNSKTLKRRYGVGE